MSIRDQRSPRPLVPRRAAPFAHPTFSAPTAATCSIRVQRRPLMPRGSRCHVALGSAPILSTTSPAAPPSPPSAACWAATARPHLLALLHTSAPPPHHSLRLSPLPRHRARPSLQHAAAYVAPRRSVLPLTFCSSPLPFPPKLFSHPSLSPTTRSLLADSMTAHRRSPWSLSN
ncbi:hypothetical protein B0H14DRAFT_1246897 [Mycena olivaceomarginata]|nr:hypothetical protein B0H14DRAFT_1246897 [Mycena olivaceomarginata]